MPAKEQVWEHLGSNSALAGGLERYFTPSEEAPQEKAAAIRLVLTTRVPTIAFVDSCLGNGGNYDVRTKCGTLPFIPSRNDVHIGHGVSYVL